VFATISPETPLARAINGFVSAGIFYPLLSYKLVAVSAQVVDR
jgi:hypothetical protein